MKEVPPVPQIQNLPQNGRGFKKPPNCCSALLVSLCLISPGVCSKNVLWLTSTVRRMDNRESASRTHSSWCLWTGSSRYSLLWSFCSRRSSASTRRPCTSTRTAPFRTSWAVGVSTKLSSLWAFQHKWWQRLPRLFLWCWWENSSPGSSMTSTSTWQQLWSLLDSACSCWPAKMLSVTQEPSPRSPASSSCSATSSLMPSLPTGRENFSRDTTWRLSRWWPVWISSPWYSPAQHSLNKVVTPRVWHSCSVIRYFWCMLWSCLCALLSASYLFSTLYRNLGPLFLPLLWPLVRVLPFCCLALCLDMRLPLWVLLGLFLFLLQYSHELTSVDKRNFPSLKTLLVPRSLQGSQRRSLQQWKYLDYPTIAETHLWGKKEYFTWDYCCWKFIFFVCKMLCQSVKTHPLMEDAPDCWLPKNGSDR